MKYYRNGLLFYTSAKAPAYPLAAAASFIKMNTMVANAVMSTSPVAVWLQQQHVFIDFLHLEVHAVPARRVGVSLLEL